MLNSFFSCSYMFFIKYGELVLKKGNRNLFIEQLSANIKKAFFDYKFNLQKKFDYLLIEFEASQNRNEVIEILKNIPGIVSFYEVKQLDIACDENDIVSSINEDLMNAKKFRVTVKRKNKQYPLTSMQFASNLAAFILKKYSHLSVDLHHYDFNVQVEIHNKSFFVLTKKQNGFGGLPISKNNKTLVLISGGIDSPVAAKLMLKKGFFCDFVTFVSPPYTSNEAKQKTIDLFKKVTLNGRICNSRLFIINYTNIQSEIAHISNQAYRINLMRRSFFRIAQQLGHYLHTYTITTGESLGQVASQTIESMRTISLAINPYFLVFRPLLTYDKEEIITKAKEYKTYETSILPFADSCSIFAPRNPITSPDVNISKSLENEIELLLTLEQETTKKENMEVVYANQK